MSEPRLLEAEITPTSALADGDRRAMLALMHHHFRDCDEARFARDLAEKPWAILLRGADGGVAGFSTLDVMEATIDGRAVRAVYSGDTIIDAAHRATTALPRAFLRFLARPAGLADARAEWFWFYVCKGYRTYRFLPVFYHRFYPHPDLATPDFEGRVLDTLALRRFGQDYDASTCIVRVPGDYALREGVGDVTEERLQDPYVRFFAHRNPGWTGGEELVCLASLARENLRPKPLAWLDQEVKG